MIAGPFPIDGIGKPFIGLANSDQLDSFLEHRTETFSQGELS
jgi:hypothetical protein